MKQVTRSILSCAVIATLGAAVPASAQTQSTPKTGASSTQTGVQTATVEHSKSMERLTQAAQRLRETIQALATAPAGEQRNAAMASARQALLDTQQAMIDLPPELRTRRGPMSDVEYAKAMDELKQAAQRLRDSAQAMAQQPAGERRNEAIEQVNKALIEVNQAMAQLPWEPSSTRVGGTPGTTAAGAAAASGSGGMAASAFDRLDRNHDGFISRDEFMRQHGAKQSAASPAQR